jgi:hypothetical protein
VTEAFGPAVPRLLQLDGPSDVVPHLDRQVAQDLGGPGWPHRLVTQEQEPPLRGRRLPGGRCDDDRGSAHARVAGSAKGAV